MDSAAVGGLEPPVDPPLYIRGACFFSIQKENEEEGCPSIQLAATQLASRLVCQPNRNWQLQLEQWRS
jgi:hypothetical protein